eukprot:c27715_g3_i1 orf=1003-2493(+)
MDQWRAFFARAGADIWTVIEQAIVLAATEYPKEFKDKRSDIAETLFSRRSVQLQPGDTDVTRISGSVVTCATTLNEEKIEDARPVFSVETDRHHCSYDQAVTLTDVLEEETLSIKEIYRIKEILAEPDQSAKILIDSLQRLEHMEISVEALKLTEIGKQVNSLRKHSSKRIRTLVKLLVRGWKDLVDEWVNTAGDVAAAAIAGSGGGGKTEAENEEQGLPSPPLDEGAWLAASTTSLEISQFLNFMDDLPTGCTDANAKEDDGIHSLDPDCLHIFSKSQSRIMQLDHGKCDTEASMHHCDRGMRVPEERRSTNRVDYNLPDRLECRPELDFRNSISQNTSNQDLDQHGRLLTSKIGVGSSGPRRPTNDLSNTRIGAATGSSGPGRPSKGHTNQSPSQTFISQPDKAWKLSSSNQKSTFANDHQVAQRLELSKRKLHEGYQQAENARKQRTVQLVEFPDLPKGGPNQVKVNGSVQSRPGPQNGYWYQNRSGSISVNM